MNRRGFTLIELLAVIVLIGILAVLIVPGLLNDIEKANQISYDTLIKNIVTASQMYYEECEYGDLSDSTKYNEYACSISGNTIETTLGTLANTGFLKISNTKEVSGKEIKVVLNPKDKNDISECQIQIQKVVTTETNENNIENYSVTYIVKDITGINCPTAYE